MLMEGKNYKEIAKEIGRSTNTISSHMTVIYQKTETDNLLQLGVWALTNGYGDFKCPNCGHVQGQIPEETAFGTKAY